MLVTMGVLLCQPCKVRCYQRTYIADAFYAVAYTKGSNGWMKSGVVGKLSLSPFTFTWTVRDWKKTIKKIENKTRNVSCLYAEESRTSRGS